jgi:energy-coupling factor transporter ATP-binding protein EcfA2
MIIGISGKKNSGKDTVAAIINYLVWKKGVEDGKTTSLSWTLKDFMEGRPNNHFQNKKFADKLKNIVCMLLGCTRSQLEDRRFKEQQLPPEWDCYNVDGVLLPRGHYENDVDNNICEERFLQTMSPRLMLQLIGTEGGRNLIHPNIWVNSLMADYQQIALVDNTEDELIFDYPDWIITDMRFPNEKKAVEDKKGITIRVNRNYQSYNDKIEREVMFGIKDEHPSETALDNASFEYIINNDGTLDDLVKKVEIILRDTNII